MTAAWAFGAAAMLIAVFPLSAAAAPGDVYTPDFGTATVWRLGAHRGRLRLRLGAADPLGDLTGGRTRAGRRLSTSATRRARSGGSTPRPPPMTLFADVGAGYRGGRRVRRPRAHARPRPRPDDVARRRPRVEGRTTIFNGPGTFEYESMAVMRNGDILISSPDGRSGAEALRGRAHPVIWANPSQLTRRDDLSRPTSATSTSSRATATASCGGPQQRCRRARSIRADVPAGSP